MQMKDVIRRKRRECGLTQEQVADLPGYIAARAVGPAVENGYQYASVFSRGFDGRKCGGIHHTDHKGRSK